MYSTKKAYDEAYEIRKKAEIIAGNEKTSRKDYEQANTLVDEEKEFNSGLMMDAEQQKNEDDKKIGEIRDGLQEAKAKDRWEELYNKKQPYREKPAVKLVTRFFEEYGEELQDGKILDLGCGNGRNLRYVVKQGYDVEGIEISEEAIRQLHEDFRKENLTAKIRQGSFYDLPYEDGQFDCVMCINVFQYNDWRGAEKAFQEAGRILKDNGLFLLSIRSTSRDLPKDRIDVPDKGITVMSKQGAKKDIKFHYFSEEEIRELADKNFLEVMEIKDVVGRQKNAEEGDIQTGNFHVVLRKKTAIPHGRHSSGKE